MLDEVLKPSNLSKLDKYSQKEIYKFIDRQTKKNEKMNELITEMFIKSGEGSDGKSETYFKIWKLIQFASKLSAGDKLICYSILEELKKKNLEGKVNVED